MHSRVKHFIHASKILTASAFLILVNAGVLLGAPNAKGDDIVIGPGQPIRIATMDMPQFGWLTREAVDLAVEQFGGTLFGHPIQTKHFGRGCDSHGIARHDGFIEGLIREAKTVGLIGPICSGRSGRIVQTLSDARILTISPANTHPDFTNPIFHDFIPFYFRTASSDSFQGPASAEFALTATNQGGLGSKTAAIVYYDPSFDSYSTALREGFRDAFIDIEENRTVVAECALPSCDLGVFLDSLVGVDLIYAPIFGEIESLYAELRQRDPNGAIRLLGSDGTFGFFPPNPVEFYVSNLNEIGPHHSTFVEQFSNRYGYEPGPFYSLAYDATSLMLMALESVGQPAADGSLRIDPTDLLAFMNDDANYPFEGAGGTYQDPIHGDLNPAGWAVFKVVEEGGLLPVFP